MFRTVQQFFQDARQPQQTPEQQQQQLNLAAAALLVEVMRIDNQILPQEEQQFIQSLELLLSVPAEQTRQLLALARQEVNNTVDLYRFTKLINEHYSRTEKYRLLVALWQIAYADQQLDKYEESTIRKICDLIYMDHVDFIRAKKDAQTSV